MFKNANIYNYQIEKKNLSIISILPLLYKNYDLILVVVIE